MSEYSLKVDQAHDHIRLDVYLTHMLKDIPSRSFVKKLIDGGHVTLNTEVVKAHHKVVDGDNVHVEIPEGMMAPEEIKPENIPLDIIHEDDQILVINKPTGLLVHPATGTYTGTLVNAILYHCDKLSDVNTHIRPGIVHRLDQDTSGLMVVVKDNKSHEHLAKQFERHEVKKCYIAIVKGQVEFDEGIMDAPLGRHKHHREKRAVLYDESAKEAQTQYRVIKRKDTSSYVELRPKTGRMHQLRVHMAHLGHPILGDAKYGDPKTFPRLALHALTLGFKHPQTDKYVEFSSEAPKEFLDWLL